MKISQMRTQFGNFEKRTMSFLRENFNFFKFGKCDKFAVQCVSKYIVFEKVFFHLHWGFFTESENF